MYKIFPLGMQTDHRKSCKYFAKCDYKMNKLTSTFLCAGHFSYLPECPLINNREVELETIDKIPIFEEIRCAPIIFDRAKLALMRKS